MTGLIAACEKHFNCTDLYDLLGASRKSKPAELRKAYYKMSLLYHPDRQEKDKKAEATIQFQILSKVYYILSDDEKRSIYDETGQIDEEDIVESKSYEQWVDYWRLLFPRVTEKNIDEFCARYKDSEDELNDLCKIYENCKGDMDGILESHMFASNAEESRLRGLIDKLIQDGRIKAYKQYTNEDPKKAARRAKQACRERNLFQRERRTKAKDSDGNMDSLAAAILENKERHLKASENFLDRLTEKYCKSARPRKDESNSSYQNKGTKRMKK